MLTYIVVGVKTREKYMRIKSIIKICTSVMAAVAILGNNPSYASAKTVEFKLDFIKSETPEEAYAKSLKESSKATDGSLGMIAGISSKQLVMANVKDYVNIREKGDEKSTIVGKLYKDCGGTIISREGGWTKLKTGDVTGYVSDKYLLFGDDAFALAEKVVTKIAVSKTSTLRVRKSPDTSAAILTLMAEGDSLEALAEQGEWVKVQFEDGDVGYVAKEYVNIVDSLDSGESIQVINKRNADIKSAGDDKKSNTKADEIAPNNAATGAVANQATTLSVSSVNPTLLLAALIQAESGTQPYEGQVAVGNVVVNRLKTGRYGASVYNVVYAKGQFGPASSGLVAKIYNQGPKATCIQAATDAINGVNYIGTATHFRSITSGYQGIVIGSHVFW